MRSGKEIWIQRSGFVPRSQRYPGTCLEDQEGKRQAVKAKGRAVIEIQLLTAAPGLPSDKSEATIPYLRGFFRISSQTGFHVSQVLCRKRGKRS